MPEQRPDAAGDPDPAALADAALALLAVAPIALGGALLVGGSLECERWLGALRARRGGAPWRRVPVAISDDRLLGGLDVTGTLARGTRVMSPGLLAEADGGTLAIPRVADAGTALISALARALDEGDVRLERDGLSAVHAARVCAILVAGSDERDQVPSSLTERLAFQLTLPNGYEPAADAHDPATESACAALGLARADVVALAAVADALGIDSPRALVLAGRAARASAAVDGRTRVTDADLACAVQLVLAPRATREPVDPAEPPPAPPPPSSDADEPADAPPPETDAEHDTPSDAERSRTPAELLIDAARAALPPDVLALAASGMSRSAAPRGASGRRGEEQRDDARGRRVGTRQGHPKRGARLDLVESLRAAAPWQRARAAMRGPVTEAGVAPTERPIEIRGEDLRVQRRVRRTGTTTLFVVDASGSAALGRLAEAKGAVELLLAASYVRRDRVGVIAFKGTGAEVLLPPTRALTRARRALAGLPAGGGTPLAAALLAVGAQVDLVRRDGARAAVVLLTDGRANIALDGTPGRARAREDAHRTARLLRARGVLVVLVDTSPRGDPEARALAPLLGARYVALPVVTARGLHDRVRALVDAP